MIEMNNVVELDLRTGEKEEINARRLANKAIKQKVDAAYGDVGLKVEVKEIEEPEKFVDSYYKNQGFRIIKMDSNSYRQSELDQVDEIDEKNKAMA